ncbi:MAG: aminotransferase class I/II-fold pyridoxal phosphate-dependent enzyme, partial [Gammaproteobacteria bacterium]|nr:aminotransferase class I/II-fold pyridoxal phosphate-dependent enzyme [Gammaproteobacteria bacterium]
LLAQAKALEAQGRDVIHMEVGEPDFTSPQAVVDAGIAALRQGKTHYTSALGLPELRQTIADYYDKHFAQKVDAETIVITPGASGGLQLLMASLLNPGDKVLLTDPGYPANRNFVHLYSAEPVSVAVDASNNFFPSLEQLEQTWDERCKLLIIASPANPTGTVLSSQQLQQYIHFIENKQGYLLVDEIYQGLEYDQASETAVKRSDRVFVINSFSKYFGMTGWRIGWMVAPSEWIEGLDRLAQNIYLATSTPAQYAALAAFAPEVLQELNTRRDELKKRRDFLLQALPQLGFELGYKPTGAFYIYADCRAITTDSFQFAQRLLIEQAVAVTPGVDFGNYQANTHVRFAYTTKIERLQQALERLQAIV